MALIIEEISRAHRVHTRHRMEEDRATLGRSFNNAVIVEDPHVDPVHAEVIRDEDGCYVLRDLQSLNGVQLLRNCRDKSVKPAVVTEHLIQSGDEIQIGKSRLRFTDTDNSVAPAIPLHSAETVFDRLATPMVAVGLCLLVAGLSLWLGYLGTANKVPWTKGIEVITNTIIGLLIYAAAWSFIGRVVRHESHFLAHLSIAGAAVLLFTGWQWFSTLLDYNFSISQAMPLVNTVALGILLPVVLWCAAYLALNLTPRWRLAAAILVPWCFLGLAAAMQIGEMDEFSESPQVSKELKYKDLLWRKPVPLQDFLAQAPDLFDIPLGEKDSDKASDKATQKSATDGETGSNEES
ncbi:FHA domain-containing protein [Microbulbifer sp. SA54]|uniref:FHA domain-containing protein n=1 Tax=Microbulbifer sp. SA54 TaxID=3401577 RepID=UPI003AAA3DF6